MTEHNDRLVEATPSGIGDQVVAGQPLSEEPTGDRITQPLSGPPAGEASPRPGTGPAAVSEAEPGYAQDVMTTERLIDPADADRFQNHWRDVKADFVDDPTAAVERAGVLAGEVVEELTTLLAQRRKDVDENWRDDDTADTERLRVALRDYGVLLEHILAF
ncbi:MAG: hypothetical protein JWR24_4379 [Actinoallomurus sp.]|jgi:hypothetical protein|nr:hypothetical protein [Actinoallomurus sp.]